MPWGGGLGQPGESLGSATWEPGCRGLGWSSMRIASIAKGLCCEAGEEHKLTFFSFFFIFRGSIVN